MQDCRIVRKNQFSSPNTTHYKMSPHFAVRFSNLALIPDYWNIPYFIRKVFIKVYHASRFNSYFEFAFMKLKPEYDFSYN